MALEEYQVSIDLDNLYEVKKKGGVSGSEQLNPSIFINVGDVDIYGYNGATEPTSYATMGALQASNTAVGGTIAFDVIPKYIAVKQNTGTTTEIVLSGVEIVADLGAIS